MGLYWKRLNRQTVYWSMTVVPLTFVAPEFVISQGIVAGLIPAIVWAVVVAVGGSVALSFACPAAPREGWEPFFEARISEATARAWEAARSGTDLFPKETEKATGGVAVETSH